MHFRLKRLLSAALRNRLHAPLPAGPVLVSMDLTVGSKPVRIAEQIGVVDFLHREYLAVTCYSRLADLRHPRFAILREVWGEITRPWNMLWSANVHVAIQVYSGVERIDVLNHYLVTARHDLPSFL